MDRRPALLSSAASGLFLLFFILGASFPAIATAGEAPRGDRGHCVVRTDGVDDAGALVVVGATCYGEFSLVLQQLGAPPDVVDRVVAPTDLTRSDMARLGVDTTQKVTGSSSALSVIGIHYDGTSATGSSYSVTGSSCAGGYLNMSSAWNNRARSTINGCPTIRHFDGFNVVGTYQDTVGYGGNLTYMDRRTSSVQYL